VEWVAAQEAKLRERCVTFPKEWTFEVVMTCFLGTPSFYLVVMMIVVVLFAVKVHLVNYSPAMRLGELQDSNRILRT
jgi:ABC-type dipeptide/oligopeptide/nickel transport system permease component